MQTNNKLREACANIAEYARAAMCHATDTHVLGYLNQIEGWAKAALAEPVKNWEVGTAEEQRKRFGEFCQSHSWHEIDGEHCRASCPLCHGDKAPCDELEWAQMPYESEAANGE